ncbi:MAG TPA: hypothetical protein VK906_01580 [Egicoccus sp.]|nr:hypothetical protein [Egicoccus sp.]HSK21831.1 hypothetical protein [Egicoccus sp.]
MPTGPRSLRPDVAGRALVIIGAVGVVAGLVGLVVGLRLLSLLDDALEDSLGVSAEAVDALGASVEVAGETLRALDTTLADTAQTTRDLGASLTDAETVLRATADLSEDDIAGGLAAVQDTLPALIQVASVIDTTLNALSLVPFGPDYDPGEPFPDSLRALQDELDGMPEALQEQAALIRDGADSLGTVRGGTGDIADGLDDLHATISNAGELIDDYATTASDARDLVTGNQEALDRQLSWARVLVVLLALSFVAGQAVPLGIGWLLTRPGALAAFVATDGP